MNTEKDYLTCYEFVKKLDIDTKRVESGLKPRPTQMGYNYVKNNLIKSVIRNNQTVILKKDYEEFLIKFKKRNNIK